MKASRRSKGYLNGQPIQRSSSSDSNPSQQQISSESSINFSQRKDFKAVVHFVPFLSVTLLVGAKWGLGIVFFFATDHPLINRPLLIIKITQNNNFFWQTMGQLR